MRIYRHRPHARYRRRSQGAGCLPILVIIGLFAGVGLASRDWVLQWVNAGLPRSAGFSLSEAQAAFASADLASVIAMTQPHVADHPSDIAATTLLARALIYHSYFDYGFEKERQTALQITTRALNHSGRLPELMGIHAFALQANGQPDEASRHALYAIERLPENMPARLALSLSYSSQGIFAASLREAQRAIEIAQSSAPDWQMDAHRIMAWALSDLGRYADAIVAIETAASHNRRMLPLHFERALYALQLSNTSGATASYFSVIAFDPDNAKARLRLCELSSRLAEREAALGYCNEVIDRAPGWSDAWYQLGREYFLLGDLRQAQQALGRCSTLQTLQAVPVEERRFECWYMQGQAAEVLGDCPTLLRIYNEWQTMTRTTQVPQTWSYPPEGPPGCVPEVTEAAPLTD